MLWIILSKQNDTYSSKNKYIQYELPRLRRRKICVRVIEEEEFPSIFEDDEAVLLLPEIYDCIYIEFVKECNQRRIPVITFETLRELNKYQYSYISESVTQTIWKVLSYLNDYKKTDIAFFGTIEKFSDAEKLSILHNMHSELSPSDAFYVF